MRRRPIGVFLVSFCAKLHLCPSWSYPHESTLYRPLLATREVVTLHIDLIRPLSVYLVFSFNAFSIFEIQYFTVLPPFSLFAKVSETLKQM